MWLCLSLEAYVVERLEQLCHFTSRSELVITLFTLPSLFSCFITQSLILPVTLFLSANIFVVVHYQEVPMLHLVYCNSK
jgi:DMSO/TMAO reductase YedYZ heme-binding membrane subunit